MSRNPKGQIMTLENDEYVKQIKAQVKELGKVPLHMLGCRRGAMGHHWQLVRPDWKPTSRGVVGMAKQCTNCYAVMRVDVSRRFGEYLSRPRYDYPEGYLMHGTNEMGPITSRAVRAAFLSRMEAEIDELPIMVVLTGEVEDG